MDTGKVDVIARALFAALTALTVSACSVQAGPAAEAVSPPDMSPVPAPTTPVEPAKPAPPPAPFPAFTPSAPKVVDLGGKVLTNPVVVTITFPGDANVATYEALGDGLGKSDYWSEIVSEYGVGAVTSGAANHVHMTTPFPATLTYKNREAYFATNIQNGIWPAPTPQTLYLVYIPRGTAYATKECQAEDGDHRSLTVAGTEVAYAVVIDCDGNTIADNTASATHEIAEAVLDPYDTIAYMGVGDELAWEVFQLEQTETGDMCEYLDEPNTTTNGFPFTVQRQWSNKAAAAGHDPCVPAGRAPYFSVAVLDKPGTITANLSAIGGEDGASGKGFSMKVGESRTFEVGFYSDAPTGDWTLSAIELDPTADSASTRDPAANSTVALVLDKTTGKNGDKAKLTVTRKKAAAIKASLVVLVSTLGGKRNMTPLLVGD